jgi:hypothetical protein
MTNTLSPLTPAGLQLLYYGELSVPSDCIFVTDVGLAKRSEAWYWLMLGNHIYDEHFDEITMHDLEHKIDPHSTMNPLLLRGELWKTVPSHFWQADDGGAHGPLPSQPGLTLSKKGIATKYLFLFHSLIRNRAVLPP